MSTFSELIIDGVAIKVDLSEPLDISFPIKEGNATAWYVPPVRFEPVKMEGFIGDVSLGGSVNFRNIFFNPHGHGTHTECLGHISREFYSLNDSLKSFFFIAQLITVIPEPEENNDQVITIRHFKDKIDKSASAIIIRTVPNNEEKITKQYSNTNPPYMDENAILYLNSCGIKHLLIDTPSVDKEVDGGLLKAHKAFWNYPTKPEKDKTITELIFVPNNILDGVYLLNLMIAPFENDASPSKPILYKIIK